MFFDTILAKIAPYECLGCASEGVLLCTNCTASLQPVPVRCYRCRRITEGYKTCQTCRGHSDLHSVVPRTIYDDLAKALVWQLKFNGAQAAAREMASLMPDISDLKTNVVLVPVPTATSRLRKRGYDQAVLLARALAVQQNVPYLTCLRRLGQAEQVGASRQQRVTQLAQAYRCVHEPEIKGRHVVLVDDVLTTGATLEAAARAVKAAGAQRVSALVFAQA